MDELANGATKQGVSLSLISGCHFVNLCELGKMQRVLFSCNKGIRKTVLFFDDISIHETSIKKKKVYNIYETFMTLYITKKNHTLLVTSPI